MSATRWVRRKGKSVLKNLYALPDLRAMGGARVTLRKMISAPEKYCLTCGLETFLPADWMDCCTRSRTRG